MPDTPPPPPLQDQQLALRITRPCIGAAVALDLGNIRWGPPGAHARTLAPQGPWASWKARDFGWAQLSPPFWLWVFAPLRGLWARFCSLTPARAPGASHRHAVTLIGAPREGDWSLPHEWREPHSLRMNLEDRPARRHSGVPRPRGRSSCSQGIPDPERFDCVWKQPGQQLLQLDSTLL